MFYFAISEKNIMKVTTNQIVPGKIVYHVYGMSRQRTKNSLFGGKKIITSEVYNHDGVGKRFDCVEIFENDNNPFEVKGHKYIDDCGMGDRIYNLNRLFSTMDEALDFIEQCKAGVFKDPVDQDFYNNDDELFGLEDLYESFGYGEDY